MYINVSYNSFLLGYYQVRFEAKPLICEDKYPENSAFQDFSHIHSITIIEILSSYHQVKLTPKWNLSHVSWCRIRINGID